MKEKTGIAHLIQANRNNYSRLLCDICKGRMYEGETAVYFSVNSQDPTLNTILEFAPREENVVSAIEELQHFYSSKKLPNFWWINEDTPSFEYIHRHLKTLGFHDMPVSGMASQLSSLSVAPIVEKNLQIVEAVSKKDFHDWSIPISVSFEIENNIGDEFTHIFEQLQHKEIMPCYTGYYRNEPIASLTIFFDDKNKVASFYNAATLPEWRKKGLATEMITHCLNIIAQKGYDWIVLQANPNSAGIFEKLGFKTYSTYQVYYKE